MNSSQLCWILSDDKFTKLSFKGVYAINEMKLMKTISYLFSFVINLDLSYRHGSHWVAVYFDRNGEGEYFDSFAHYPPHEVEHFLCSHAKGWQYNCMQVQEIYTTMYGQIVVLYIYQKSQGLMLQVILHKYFRPHNKLRNNLLVRDFVKLHYHHDAKIIDPNFIRHITK